MREAYIDIVRQRLADPAITPEKKMSFVAIAKRLTDKGFKSPKEEKITYKIVRRLSEIVGIVEPLVSPALVPKLLTELEVGDKVEIISRKRAFYGMTGIIHAVNADKTGFLVALSGRSKPLPFFAEEVRHEPDESRNYDMLSLAEKPL